MAMETTKREWLAKGRFMNELHPLEVIKDKSNRLSEGCQFLQREGDGQKYGLDFFGYFLHDGNGCHFRSLRLTLFQDFNPVDGFQ